MNKSYRISAAAALAAAVVISLLTGNARAVTRTWTAGNGEWSVGANWSGSQAPQAGDDVVITNTGVAVTLTNSTPYLGSLTISNTATLTFTNWDTTLSATTVTVEAQGTLTCAGPFTDDSGLSNRVHIVCSNLTVASNGQITTAARGFRGGLSGGSRTDGYGPGGGYRSYWNPYGGGHGGGGGNPYAGKGLPYGDAAAPETPGSGGGGANGYVGGHGGGAVCIAASGSVSVNGTISADAEDIGSRRAGSGAGGSVYITCRTLSATGGVISAQGGNTTSSQGVTGGGGGRIAIINNPSAQSNAPAVTLSLNACPGERHASHQSTRGDMGSLYLVDPALLNPGLAAIQGRLEGLPPFSTAGFTVTDRWLGIGDGVSMTVTGNVKLSTQYARLEVGGNGHAWYSGLYRRVSVTSAPTMTVQGDLVVSNASRVYIYASITNATNPDHGALIDVSGALHMAADTDLFIQSHYTNGGSPKLSLGSLRLETNATISADSAGYMRGDGSGTPGRWGYGPGRGYYRGGGGHGGAGGNGSVGTGGSTYGVSNAPLHAGSGGGSPSTSSYGRGGVGAGAIRLYVSGSCSLDAGAAINAVGGSGAQSPVVNDRQGGGGAGGTIYLRCRILNADSGVSFNADGGHSGIGNGGGGGGGRIAVLRMFDYSADPDNPVSTSVLGGNGSLNSVLEPGYYGETGTVVFAWIPPDQADVHNQPASNVTTSAANLNGYLFATGTSATAVSVYWGNEDGGDPTSGLWDAEEPWPAGAWAAESYPTTNVLLPASNLFYYYRYYATNDAGADWPTNSEHFLGGAVWVTAPDPDATEQWLTPGTYRVHRAATGTNEDTIVNFTMAGSAVETLDYWLSPSNTVTIPAGQTSADVVLHPLGDPDGAEGPERAWLVLQPGLYATGSPASNVITIADFPIVPGTNRSLRSGLWQTPTNWSVGRRPEAGDSVFVEHNMTMTTSTPQLASCTVSNAELSFANWGTILNAIDILLTSTGTVTTVGPFRDDEMSNHVYIACNAMTIDAGSAIDVSGRGFAGGGPGEDGHGPGGGNNATYDGSGAGHGGRGGASSPGDPYGDPVRPLLPGSGGGDGQQDGMPGGGAVRLEVSGRLTLNGSILADGPSSTRRAGHGSGGSIYVTCNTIVANNARVSAEGGGTTSAQWPGTGAGGRIALVVNRAAQTNEPPAAITFSTASGDIPSQDHRGGMGTLYLNEPSLINADMGNVEGMLYGLPAFTKDGLALNDRWIGFADGVTATITGTVALDGPKARMEIGGSAYRYVSGLYYRMGATSPPMLTVEGDLLLTNGPGLYVYSSPTNSTWPDFGALLTVDGTASLLADATVFTHAEPENGGSPEFRVGDLLMETNSAFNANEGGYPRSTGVDRWGMGPGKGYYRGGAGYGGAGYAYDAVGGITYGSSNAPVQAGSGGGSSGTASYYRGGNGAGAIRLHATGNVTLNPGATLTSNGGRGSWDTTNSDRRGGGGSGGSIYITCFRFRAADGVTLSAIGGDAARHVGGGGGGGRIAIHRKMDRTTGSPTVTVAGGGGRDGADWEPAYDGAVGTIVWIWTPFEGSVFTLR